MEAEQVIGYLIPEFPGQTHVWMWREITHMREWGARIQLFSTRPPQQRDRARHAFSANAATETIYLWPRSVMSVLSAVLWAMTTRLSGFLRCIWFAARLPVEHRHAGRVVMFVPMACILAKEACMTGISHLHCHTCANGAVLAMMLKRLTGIPYSLTLNANIEWWGGAMHEKLSEAEFTIAITERLLAQVRRDYPELKPRQALLGRIGVDTFKWVPASNDEETGKSFQVVTVARLHASKGHDLLLRAMAQVSAAACEVRLTIIGDGPERAALEALSAELAITPIVRFAGSLGEEEIIEELSQADLFVLASHAEPLGVVYMEAMAMGVPTIGTSAGGVGEIITHDVDGYLVSPHDLQSLVMAIRELMNDTALRRRLGEAGRQTIVERFDSRLGAATLYRRLTGCAPADSLANESEVWGKVAGAGAGAG